jgi:hypothetical protein
MHLCCPSLGGDGGGLGAGGGCWSRTRRAFFCGVGNRNCVREPFWGVRGVQSCMHGAWSLARESLRCALGANCSVRGALGADAAVQGFERGALRGVRAHWRGMGGALGARRWCWIAVDRTRSPAIGFWGIRLCWADPDAEVMVHAGRIRMAAGRQLTETS